MLALGTGIGGGLVLGRPRSTAAPHGFAGPSSGTSCVDSDGAGLPGRLPGPRLPRGAGVGHGDRLAGERIARERPDSDARAAARGRARRSPAALVTELAHDGDPTRSEVLAAVGRRLGAGIAGLVNAFDPEVVVVGGGAVAAGDLLLEPARDEAAAARALPPHRGRRADRARRTSATSRACSAPPCWRSTGWAR